MYIEELIGGGIIKNSGVADAAVFFLPVGYRPNKSLCFTTYAATDEDNPYPVARIDIYTDGGVQVCMGSNIFVALNISFVPDK